MGAAVPLAAVAPEPAELEAAASDAVVFAVATVLLEAVSDFTDGLSCEAEEVGGI